ncbi:transposase [Streptomyces sp. NPDC021093]|uniref:transposase n=1 Tax=Streptomyces sp. NPDC021093 TaxID=3365112 RepID=UPI0037A911A6
MRQLIAAREWLTVCQLPPHAPELNPVEAVWSPPRTILGQPRQARHQPADQPTALEDL